MTILRPSCQGQIPAQFAKSGVARTRIVNKKINSVLSFQCEKEEYLIALLFEIGDVTRLNCLLGAAKLNRRVMDHLLVTNSWKGTYKKPKGFGADVYLEPGSYVLVNIQEDGLNLIEVGSVIRIFEHRIEAILHAGCSKSTCAKFT